MSARNSRSTRRSISVTRSIAPFLSTRMAPPRCAIWISPARMTDSTAVARKTGGSGSGTGRQLLDHAHFHAALCCTAQHDVVHETAHEEDAPSAGLQDVFWSQRIGDLFRLEALSLIEHAHDQLTRVHHRRKGELDGHELAVVLAVAVFDRVDDGFPDRHSDPVD